LSLMGIPRAHAPTSLSSFVHTLSDSGSPLLAFRSLPLGGGSPLFIYLCKLDYVSPKELLFLNIKKKVKY